MLELIESKRAEIAELCHRFHVRRLEVFGSAVGGEFDPAASDIDFLVEFDSDPRARSFAAYFGLKEALEALLGRPVDLVEAGAVTNPYLRASIERSREPLYGA